MSRSRSTAIVVAFVGGFALASSPPAYASLQDVRLGNFYYEDATAGDGKIEITQGDQIRFIAEDNGPGTPHTVEIDELNIHSGGLSTGQTYTTPVINQAGTYELYCKFHENRGHVTTLVVRASATTTTTTRPTTTTTSSGPAPTTTTAGKSNPTTATSAPSGMSPTPQSNPPDGDSAVPEDQTPADGETTEPASDQPAGDDSARDPEEDAATVTTAPSGIGQLSDEELAALPATTGSLEAVLGRPPAARGPWTRAIRIALVAAVPLVAAASLAARRHRRLTATPDG